MNKILTYTEIIEKSLNMSLLELENTYLLLREGIRQYMSRILVDTDAENPMMFNLPIESLESLPIESLESFGISDTMKPVLEEAYCTPVEGIIYIKLSEFDEYLEIDEFGTDLLLEIINTITNSDNYETDTTTNQ